MYRVIDISKHQNSFNAKKAKSFGIEGVIARGSYASAKDIRFDTFAAEANAAGLKFGSYIYANWHYVNAPGILVHIEDARREMKRQITSFLSIIRQKKITSWVAVDQELEAGYYLGLSKADNTRLLNEACDILKNAGYSPCLYCSVSWAMVNVDMSVFKYPLWAAWYYANPNDPDFDNCVQYPYITSRYSKYLKDLGDRVIGWQFGRINYGSKYGVASGNIDRDWFYKDIEGGSTMNFVPVKNKKLVVTKESNPHCQAFNSPSVDDPHYTNLKLGEYPIKAKGDTVNIADMTAAWYQLDYNEPLYVLDLPDRCHVEDIPVKSGIQVIGEGKLADFIRSLAAYLETFEKGE